jgi:hypothetical protein
MASGKKKKDLSHITQHIGRAQAGADVRFGSRLCENVREPMPRPAARVDHSRALHSALKTRVNALAAFRYVEPALDSARAVGRK